MDEPAVSAIINLVDESVSEEIIAALEWASRYKLDPGNDNMSMHTLVCLVYMHEIIKASPIRVAGFLGSVLEFYNVREVGNLFNHYSFIVDEIYDVIKIWKSTNHVPTIFDLKLIADKHKVLHFAASHGHLAMAEWLIRRGVMVDVTDSTGKTPLHLAAAKGHRNVMLMLINKGASVFRMDRFAKTPFEVALDECRFDSADLLHPYLFSSICDSAGESIVFKMIREQKEEHVKYLLSFAIITKTNSRHETLLHTAACVGNVNIINEIIRRSSNHPELINAVDMRNWTPLTVAVHRHNIETSKIFIEAGAKIYNSIIQEAVRIENLPFLNLIKSFPALAN